MRRLPILFAVAVIVGGTIAVGYFSLTDSGDTGAQAPTQRDLTNAKLKVNGLPTLPPEDTQTAVVATLIAEPPGTAVPTTVRPWCGPPGLEFTSTQFGALRSCMRVGQYWVLATVGDRATGVRGVVGVLSCPSSEQACRAVAATPPSGPDAIPTGWQTYESPLAGGLKITGAIGNVVLLGDAGDLCFDLESRTFETQRPCP